MHPARRSTTLLLATILLMLLIVHATQPVNRVGDATYISVTLGAGLISLLVTLRRPRGQRAPWVWIAVAIVSSGVGDACYTALFWIRGESPDASIADAFYLASYVALTIGLLDVLGFNRAVGRRDIDSLIDMGSFATVAVVVVVQFSGLTATFADGSIPITVRLIWFAYPVLDAALLAVLLRAVLTRHLLDVSGYLVVLGISCWLASDFALLLLGLEELQLWLNLGWMLGAAAMAGAVLHSPAIRSPLVRPPQRVGNGRVIVSLCPLLIPGGIGTWVHLHGGDPNPVPLYAGTVALILLAIARSTRLVRAREVQERRLASSERYYQAVAENSSDAVIVIDAGGRIVNDAPNLAQMLGRTDVATVGADAVELFDPLDRNLAHAAIERMRATDGVMNAMELCTRRSNGSLMWLALRAVNLADDPAVGGLIVNIHDVTDRRRIEEELVHSAFHDSLTGLANRSLFHDRVEHALQRTARTGEDVAILSLDLDGFKKVNDDSGHEAGDDALRLVADRISSAVRTADTVARLGGDEFAILIEQKTDTLDEAITIAGRVLESLLTPLELADEQVTLSASVGIAVGGVGSTASSMLREADLAMYQAKNGGKAQWAVYDPKIRAESVERSDLERDLGAALAGGQFRLLYQPVVELDTERVVGFEALLRWDHPVRGVVMPDTFVPILESNGSIIAVGAWVLDEACRTGALWQALHPGRSLSMAVNLSGCQLATPTIVDEVRRALARSQLRPSSLVLEMTETVLVEDAPAAARRLHELHRLGVRLAIDDFGTGYSSLSYLRQFPIDIIKIDRSFVETITSRTRIPAIVRGLLDLGRTLRLETIAEGVERGVQRDALRDQHCGFGQGFLFARPLTADAAGELLLAGAVPSV